MASWTSVRLAKLDTVPRQKARKRRERAARRVRMLRNLALATVGVALLAIAPALLGDDVAAGTDFPGARLLKSTPGCDDFVCSEKFKTSTCVLVLVTIIVIFSVCMEQFVMDPLKEDVEETLKPIVNTLFSELTLLGFVGLFMFVVEKTGAMEPASVKIFNDATALQELFEAVHMVLFLVMCIFLASATLLIFNGAKAQARWKIYNQKAMDEKDLIVESYKKAVQYEVGGPLVTSGPVISHAEEHMLFLSIRQRFILGDDLHLHGLSDGETEGTEGTGDEGKEGNEAKKEEAKGTEGDKAKKKKPKGFGNIPHDFEMNDYLALRQGETTGEIIELPTEAWFFLECMMLAFYIVEVFVDKFVFSVVFVVFAYMLMVLNFFMERQLTQVINMLKPKIYYNQVHQEVENPGVVSIDPRVAVDVVKEEASGKFDIPVDGNEREHEPDYLNPERHKLKSKEEWGWIRNKLFGGLPDQHESLFFGGRIGPEIFLFLIRIQLMWSAIYFSVFLVVTLKTDKEFFKHQPVGLTIMIIIVLIPVIVNFFQIQEVINKFVMATSIELMKKPETIRRVRRRMTTKKAVRALKLIRMMKSKMPKSGSEKGEQSEQKEVKEIYPDPQVLNRKKRELRDLFDMFDTDQSGDIESSEMLELLRTMRMADTEEEAQKMLGELDADNSGTVEFEEFFKWMANNEADEEEGDAEEAIDSMFEMIDTDNSGSITADEFQECLSKMGTELSMEDIQAMIREVDENGDGNIDKEEFAAMVEKYAHEV